MFFFFLFLFALNNIIYIFLFLLILHIKMLPVRRAARFDLRLRLAEPDAARGRLGATSSAREALSSFNYFSMERTFGNSGTR